LDSETEVVCRSTVLLDDRQVGVVEGVQPDQLVLGVGQHQEAVALGAGDLALLLTAGNATGQPGNLFRAGGTLRPAKLTQSSASHSSISCGAKAARCLIFACPIS